MNISKGTRVRVKAMLKVVGGAVLEESVVEYFQGAGTMLSGIEKVLEGLKAGDKRDGVIRANEAFGDPSKAITKPIPRAEFPKSVDLKVGESFVATGADDGLNVIMKVDSFDDKTVTVKLIHPLADKDIEYKLEVLSVTDPSPPPLPSSLLEDDE